MAHIIDFQKAKNRLRPSVHAQAFLLIEIPAELAKELEDADAVEVMARFRLLIN